MTPTTKHLYIRADAAIGVSVAGTPVVLIDNGDTHAHADQLAEEGYEAGIWFPVRVGGFYHNCAPLPKAVGKMLAESFGYSVTYEQPPHAEGAD